MGYEDQLKAKFEPARIRATLSFAGLYQILHEMIKHAVIDEVRQFYRTGFDEAGWQHDEVAYRTKVTALDPRSKFRASALWLVDSKAITRAQADRLDAIYAHRHELSHELIKYVVDPAFEPDVDLFTDAAEILKAVARFWTSVEIDIGTFEHLGDVDIDEIAPLSLIVLQQCVDAYVGGLPSQE